MTIRRLLSSIVALAIATAAGLASAADIPLIRPIVVANRVALRWDRNLEPDLAGYRVYWGFRGDGTFGNLQDVGLDTTVEIGVMGQDIAVTARLWAAITAYDAAGNESSFSTAVSMVVTPDSSVWLLGDQNLDRRVDVLDHAWFFSTFGLQDNQVGFMARMDYDANGRIDGLDHTAFTQNYGAVR